MIFLFKNGLIEVIEGHIPTSSRSIINYYSHRSTVEKMRGRGKLSADFKLKIGRKQYDTERKSNNSSDHFDPISLGLQKKPTDIHYPKKVQGKVLPKHKLENALSSSTKGRKARQVAKSSGLLSSISELKRRD